ncbi:Uncharacterised protein [Vibrio cholerae]|uniref:Uncharacterized protein n=1 Tax=Vibrio cholerae TaxID=666 RepID=A0A655QVE8_VIBCL|nr:Uncharacterised protein [Vibrio cholerae]
MSWGNYAEILGSLNQPWVVGCDCHYYGDTLTTRQINARCRTTTQHRRSTNLI